MRTPGTQGSRDALNWRKSYQRTSLGGHNASQAHRARSDSDSPVDHDGDYRTPARHDPSLPRRRRLCQQLCQGSWPLGRRVHQRQAARGAVGRVERRPKPTLAAAAFSGATNELDCRWMPGAYRELDRYNPPAMRAQPRIGIPDLMQVEAVTRLHVAKCQRNEKSMGARLRKQQRLCEVIALSDAVFEWGEQCLEALPL